MPEISVILPTYNGEKYIKPAIESIINQTYADWELIIVDDCSTDNTPAIIKEYAENDMRIRVVSNKVNQKLPKSLNIGFHIARGNFLTWTSDDNYYDNRAFETMLESLVKNKADFVFCSYYIINDHGEKVGKTLKKISDVSALPYRNVIGACFLYRKQVLKKVGKYNENAFLVEDWDYWIRIYLHGFRITALNEILYYYREHRNSLTFRKEKEIQKAVIGILIKSYFNKKISKVQKKHVYEELLNKISNLYGKREVRKCVIYLYIFEMKKRGVGIGNRKGTRKD